VTSPVPTIPTPQDYADLDLVVRALFRDTYHREPSKPAAEFPQDSPFLSQARAVLAALSAAGRLLPPDGPPRTCGCPRVYRFGLDPTHLDTCPVIVKQREEYAELLAWRESRGYDDGDDW
jgi:hypothetical protein